MLTSSPTVLRKPSRSSLATRSRRSTRRVQAFLGLISVISVCLWVSTIPRELYGQWKKGTYHVVLAGRPWQAASHDGLRMSTKRCICLGQTLEDTTRFSWQRSAAHFRTSCASYCRGTSYRPDEYEVDSTSQFFHILSVPLFPLQELGRDFPHVGSRVLIFAPLIRPVHPTLRISFSHVWAAVLAATMTQ